MPKYHKKIVFFKILICTGKTILWTTFSTKLKWCNKIVFTVNTYTWPNCLKRSLSREFWDNGFQKDTFGTVLFFMDGRSSGTTFFGLRCKCVPFISHFFIWHPNTRHLFEMLQYAIAMSHEYDRVWRMMKGLFHDKKQFNIQLTRI